MASLTTRNGWYYLQYSDATRRKIALRTRRRRTDEALRARLEHEVLTGAFDPRAPPVTVERPSEWTVGEAVARFLESSAARRPSPISPAIHGVGPQNGLLAPLRTQWGQLRPDQSK